METSTIIISAVTIVIGLGSVYLYAYFKDKKEMEKTDGAAAPALSIPMKLQAYERLVLLCDRIALPNLVSRVNQPGLNAKEMQVLLTQTVKNEYEHNVTQQIYVSQEAWQAIRNLKEQNMLIINQVSSFLPETATGADLKRSLMDLLIENPSASLHNIVSEALSFEAKKLL